MNIAKSIARVILLFLTAALMLRLIFAGFALAVTIHLGINKIPERMADVTFALVLVIPTIWGFHKLGKKEVEKPPRIAGQ